MTRYLYRVDRKVHLQNIRDEMFRAARWRGDKDFPHKVLKRGAGCIPVGASIYRICFYSSHERAVTSLNTDYKYWNDGVITRVRYEDVLGLGYLQTWDDGFEEGDAYLFWSYDRGTAVNRDWSESGIPLALFQCENNASWRPFTELFTTVPAHSLSMGGAEKSAPRDAARPKSLLNRLISLVRGAS